MEYYVGNDVFDYKLIFILGTSRAGKSLFSKLLSTANNIEWLFEPHIVQICILSAEIGTLARDFASRLLKASCKEIINDRIFLRNANFRTTDMSSIWGHKDATNIFMRLNQLNTREDVNRYIEKNNVSFVLDIPDLLPNVAYIKQVFPNSKIIHVIRNGYDVISEVCAKGWYTIDRMIDRKDNYVLYYKHFYNESCYYLPWWLPVERSDEFLTGSDIMRACLYWLYGVGSIKDTKYIDATIKYEDIISRPRKVLEQIGKLTNIATTSKTQQIIDELLPRRKHTYPEIKDQISEQDKVWFSQIMEMYGYE